MQSACTWPQGLPGHLPGHLVSVHDFSGGSKAPLPAQTEEGRSAASQSCTLRPAEMECLPLTLQPAQGHVPKEHIPPGPRFRINSKQVRLGMAQLCSLPEPKFAKENIFPSQAATWAKGRYHERQGTHLAVAHSPPSTGLLG